MATEAQTNANRENAEKSTGPRTPQGKAISSRNSLVHGMTSGKFLPPDGDPDEFFQLLDQFRGRFQPFDEAEDALVERLVAAEFKMRSVRYANAALFHIHAAEDPMLERYKQEGRTNLLAWAFHSDAKYSNSFSKLIRYEGCLQREFSRALRELYMMQDERRARLAEAAARNAETEPSEPAPPRLLQKLKKRNEPNSQGRAASRTGAARLINPKIPSKLAFDSLPTPQLRSVGQALGLRRPLRPPGPPFNNLRWVFDRARVLQDPLLLTCPA